MKFLILGVLTATLALTACGPQNSNPTVASSTLPAPESSGSEMELVPSNTAQAVADQVIGMSETEAIETIAGISSETLNSRIVRRDQESFNITMDYRLDRINLQIDDGIVTTTTVG
jgi:hypothetical protein